MFGRAAFSPAAKQSPGAPSVNSASSSGNLIASNQRARNMRGILRVRGAGSSPGRARGHCAVVEAGGQSLQPLHATLWFRRSCAWITMQRSAHNDLRAHFWQRSPLPYFLGATIMAWAVANVRRLAVCLLLAVAYATLMTPAAWAEAVRIGTFKREFLVFRKVHVKFGLPFDEREWNDEQRQTWSQMGYREARFRESVSAVAAAIRQIDADVLVLTEVGRGQDVTALWNEVQRLGGNY